MGDDAQILESVIGPDFTKIGNPTYLECKYDDGVYSDDAFNNRIETSVKDGLTNACMVSLWCKTDFDMVNGDPQDGATHVLFSLFQANGTKFWVQFRGSTDRTQIVRYRNDSAEIDTFDTTNAALTWTAGDLVHVSVLIDINGIEGSADTMRIYVGDALAGNYTGAMAEETTSGGWNFILLGRGTDYAADANMVIDNVRIWDNVIDVATRIIKRNSERGGMNDQLIIS